MGEASGFYFPGLTKAEVNKVRHWFADKALEFGYISTSGPNKGKGSIGALLAAIFNGEIELVPRANKALEPTEES